MNDTPALRSRIMRAVKSKDTTPELFVRRLLHTKGYRYRLHCKDLPGNPDLVFPGRRKAVFVHGCFWHGHNCKRGRRPPKSNPAYWQAKIARNQERDKQTQSRLRALGWRVMVVWECETRDAVTLVDKLIRFLDC